MFKLILKEKRLYNWVKKGNFFFTGFVFDENNAVLKEHNAVDYLSEYYKKNNQKNKFEQPNGIFTFISILDDKLVIISDSVNFYPIFFTYLENIWIVSDDWNSLIEYKGGIEPNASSVPSFLSAGFVLGNKTLDKKILKTRAGEQTELLPDYQIRQTAIFSFLPTDFNLSRYNALKTSAFDMFSAVSNRLLNYLDSRTAVVPLSGGYDSRLIACLLKKQNYKDVVCFTYGKMNREVKISQKVAEALGYTWIFIDYTKLNLKNYIDNQDFKNYIDNYGMGFSMPYLQEYFAIKHLKNSGIIPQDSVFLPGHSGDYLGGSYVEKTAKTNISNHSLGEFLEDNYFIFKKPEHLDRQIIVEQIKETLLTYPTQNTIDAKYNPYVEDWDVKEKLSKFIFRSSFVFSHFNYDHIFPLWDTEMLGFFRRIPYEYRSAKRLYDDVLTEFYFKPLNVYFGELEIKSSKNYIQYQKIKDKIRGFFPWSLVYKRMVKNDWMYYSELTKPMEESLVKKGYKPLKYYKNFNAIICRWYLDYIGVLTQAK